MKDRLEIASRLMAAIINNPMPFFPKGGGATVEAAAHMAVHAADLLIRTEKDTEAAE